MKNYNFERIVDLRKDCNLYQKEMGEILGVPQRTYAHYEAWDVNIPIEILHELAKFHKTSVDYLTGLTDTRKPYPLSQKYHLLTSKKS